MLSTPMNEVPRLIEEAHIPTPVAKFVDNAQIYVLLGQVQTKATICQINRCLSESFAFSTSIVVHGHSL